MPRHALALMPDLYVRRAPQGGHCGLIVRQHCLADRYALGTSRCLPEPSALLTHSVATGQRTRAYRRALLLHFSIDKHVGSPSARRVTAEAKPERK